MPKKLFTRVLKVCLIIGTSSCLSLVSAGATETSASDSRPVFEISKHEIKLIVVGVYPAKETENKSVSKRIADYLRKGLAEKNSQVSVEVGKFPAYCNFPDEEEIRRQEGKNDEGTLFLYTFAFFFAHGGLGVVIEMYPCWGELGPVRFIFPVDWEPIDPNPNIRLGDCHFPGVDKWEERIFCRVKPDLDVLIYEINASREDTGD